MNSTLTGFYVDVIDHPLQLAPSKPRAQIFRGDLREVENYLKSQVGNLVVQDYYGHIVARLENGDVTIKGVH